MTKDISYPDKKTWSAFSAVYSFVAGELLMPMNRSGKRIGLDPTFWADMYQPTDTTGQRGYQRLMDFATAAMGESRANELLMPAMFRTSSEFTHLFVDGAPYLVASPFQSDYGDAVGGPVSMGEVLDEAGISFLVANGQRADHLGTELQYLSVLCDKVARKLASGGNAEEAENLSLKTAAFAEAYPLTWLGYFRSRVDMDSPEGYYSRLLEYLHGVLNDHVAASK